MLTVLLIMILLALVFEFINGFHDTANSIATVVGTKVLTPRQAIALAAVTNLAGALVGHAVAKTITSGLIDDKVLGAAIVQQMIICAMMGGIVWNLLTWYFGIPSSSTHAMVGGLVGASLGVTHMNWDVLIWSGVDAKGHGIGIYHKVVVPMIASPIAGFVIGFIVMGILFALLQKARPARTNKVFSKLQILSSGYMGWMHGMADAQKVMGVITMGLVALKGQDLPGFLNWMSHVPSEVNAAGKVEFLPPLWVQLTCAIVMASGTAIGGWRIIRTLGHKMVKLQPIHGFAAETTAATVLAVAQYNGMPVSTTHSITTAIMGVGCAKRFSALKFSLVEKILWAWVLTIPCAALVAYLATWIGRAVGFIP